MKLTGTIKESRQFEVKPGHVAKALQEEFRETVRPPDIPYMAHVDEQGNWVKSGPFAKQIRPATADEVAEFRAFEQWVDLSGLLLNKCFERRHK